MGDRTGQGQGVTNYTFFEFLQPFGASSKQSVCVSRESKLTLTENMRPFFTLFNNHHHHNTAAWVPFISRFESTMRTLTLRMEKMDEVNSLEKNPIQRRYANN